MKNFLLIVLLICLGIIFIFTGYASFAIIPQMVDKTLQQSLSMMGFPGATLPKAEVRWGAMRYENITLDEDNFSTVKTLDVEFSPLFMLLFKRFKTIRLYGLNLTGEMAQDSSITIAGWKNNTANFNPHDYPTRQFEIKNSKLSLLTTDLGGVTITYDLRTYHKYNQMNIQAHFSSAQKDLTFTANATGSIEKDGAWTSTIKVEQAKIQTPSYKATRMSGETSLKGKTGESWEATGEFRAGGFMLHGTPWTNLDADIDTSTDSKLKITGTAQSIAPPGIGLTFTTQSGKTTGRFKAETPDALKAYFQEYYVPALKILNPEALESGEQTSVDFEMIGEPPAL